MNKEHILKLKMTPPPVKKQLLHRPHLTKRLNQLTGTPITLLTSGPGYGKTTALASYVRSSDMQCVWYGVSAQDNDLHPFLQHLVSALRQIVPQFGEALLLELRKGGSGAIEDDAGALAEIFLNELIHLPQHTLLIIDDYHLVEHHFAIDRWMQTVISFLPEGDTLRLVLSSRRRPSWEQLTVLRLRGHLLELTTNDLAFTEEEIDVLFHDYYQYPLSKERIRLIYTKTEGWIIAIQLIWQQLLNAKGQLELEQILNAPRESMHDLFQFLALELFQKQMSLMRTFMLETSILDELTGEWCDAIGGRKGSYELLVQLCGDGFLTAIGEDQFRYHALFREFLRDQLRRQPERHAALHRQAMHVFVGRGRYDMALSHALELADVDETAQLLQQVGVELIRGGHLELVHNGLRHVPERVQTRYPFLRVLMGDIYRYRCQYDTAEEHYRLAEQEASLMGDMRGRLAALEGQAMLFLDTIQPGKAGPLLEEAVSLASSLPEGVAVGRSGQPFERPLQVKRQVPCERQEQLARLNGLMAENMLNAGRGTEAQAWYERSLQLLPHRNDLIFEARLCLRTGKLREAKARLERAQQLEAEAGELYRSASFHGKTLSRSHREVDLLLSLIHSLAGQPEQAKEQAEKAMMHGIRLRAPFVEACGWMRMGHAAPLMGVYELNVASECYQAASTIMDRLDVRRGSAEPLMGLCLLYGRARSTETALRYGQRGLDEAEQAQDGWLAGLISLSIGIALFYGDRLAEAERQFRECVDRFEVCGDHYGTTVSLMWLAIVTYRMEEEPAFALVMERFLAQADQRGYRFLFVQRTMFGPADTQQLIPLLIEAVKQNIQAGYASSLLSEWGLDRLGYHPGYTLRIETLGLFRVRLGDLQLEDKDWQRGKAKELFQLLVTKRHQPLTKEELLILLFPHAPEKAANRDFKVALNALQTALEPHRRARAQSYFIVRQGSAYQLNEAAGWVLDTVQFERDVRKGLEAESLSAAVQALEQGLMLYRGDYMPDRRYEDWCIEERERLQVLYMRGAERLAQCYTEMKAYDKAIGWAEQMLAKDRCWEEAYRLLIQCHFQKNNRNQAVKWYHKCQKVLLEELGVQPMPAILDLVTLHIDLDC
ncbi:BTAD domain-containing putative transcriptional regulator [Paenibacillus sp. 481]|uniref:BTAD domain-containing putative transcriptional regulator n=1 Tax=Paenibacillus sp. 481 TaxID=2835869 RepID=UPI001E2C9D64|nr:BTAD domain-containing putative transcriptional regulator [Paenibacillus sp. 481]UHA74623.1 hypothetical protein KIK04_05935 [Paenibacillus sp. 481]